jgi:hypothetical protein
MAFYITAALIAAGAGVQAYGQIQAGKAQESALKQQAEQERLAAESRELERQQKLNKALAANVVGMGVSGIKAEGTPASIALESAKNISLSEGMLGLSDRLQQAQLRRQGAAARSASNFAAAGTLLSGAADIKRI